jgi:hypothetical protein
MTVITKSFMLFFFIVLTYGVTVLMEKRTFQLDEMLSITYTLVYRYMLGEDKCDIYCTYKPLLGNIFLRS